MLSESIRAALRKALRGVYAHVPTLEECREESKSVFEDWLLVCFTNRIPVPAIDGIELRVKEVA